MKRILITNSLLLLCFVMAGTALYWSRDFLTADRRVVPDSEQTVERDLYLPEADYLKFISLGHDGLISDVILAKALTYYGSHYKTRHTFTFKHLKKLFSTALKMDPRNVEGFLMAGNLLSGIDVQEAIDILKLGMSFHPQHWKFPEMIGYIYFYQLKDSANAGKYYELAAGMPGHPPYIPSLSGKFYQESGRYKEALRVLHNFYSTTTDKRLKESFKQSIDEVEKRLKSGAFSLQAEVLDVTGPISLLVRPDRNNPQFTLAETEVVTLQNAVPPEKVNDGAWATLKPLLLQDHLTGYLRGKTVRLELVRKPDGSLERDGLNRLSASVFNENHLYQPPDLGTFPPEVEDLKLKRTHFQAGKIIALRFRVHQLKQEPEGLYIDAGTSGRTPFSAIISTDRLARFDLQRLNQLPGRFITVAGFADMAADRVTMKIYLPVQLIGN